MWSLTIGRNLYGRDKVLGAWFVLCGCVLFLPVSPCGGCGLCSAPDRRAQRVSSACCGCAGYHRWGSCGWRGGAGRLCRVGGHGMRLIWVSRRYFQKWGCLCPLHLPVTEFLFGVEHLRSPGTPRALPHYTTRYHIRPENGSHHIHFFLPRLCSSAFGPRSGVLVGSVVGVECLHARGGIGGGWYAGLGL